MKIQNINKGAALGIGIALLALNLVACDRGADSNMNANSDGVSSGYDAGYEFGVKLALLRQQQPGIEFDDAFKGLLDALSETSKPMSSAEMCASLQAADNVDTETEQPIIPARSRGFKDDFAALNARREGVVVLPSGVQYEVLKAGNGRQPLANEAVLISYQASLTNGTVFDTTYEDGEPLLMQLDEIAAPGLKEALMLMNKGAKWRVVIPPNMGFARSGNNQLRRRDLIYEIELVSIEKPAPAETRG
jgi:FKBP-type peptidyl-prolyl cis-trans isomerase